MKLKYKKISLLIFSTLTTLSLLTGCSNERSLDINRLDINAVIQENGDMKVEECFEYKFNGEYSGVFRTYEINGCDGYKIDKVSIIDNKGNEIVATEGYDQLENTYENSQNNTYIKIYTPSKNEKKKIKIEYTVLNAVQNYADGGWLYWNFYDVPQDSPVKNGTLTVSLNNKTFNTEDLFYTLYGDGSSIKGEYDSNKVSVKFKKLTSLIGIKLKFQKDFLNGDATHKASTFDDLLKYKSTKMSEYATLGEKIISGIIFFIMTAIFIFICLIFIAFIVLLIKLYNMLTEFIIKKYREKSIDMPYSNKNYDSLLPPSNIPPAYINFIHNKFSTTNLSILDSILYLINIGVYDSKIDMASNSFVFYRTNNPVTVKDKHLRFLISWLNKYDRGNGISINSIYSNINQTSKALTYFNNKNKFAKLVIKDTLKNKYAVKILGKTIISNEFLNEWSRWEKYNSYLKSRDFSNNVELYKNKIQPAIIYGVSFDITGPQLKYISKALANTESYAKSTIDGLNNETENMLLILTNTKSTLKSIDRISSKIASKHSSSSGDSGGVSSGSSFSGGGGGSSGGF